MLLQPFRWLELVIYETPKWTNEGPPTEAAYGITKLFYRELGNLCRLFNASLADLEYLLSDNPGERIAAPALR